MFSFAELELTGRGITELQALAAVSPDKVATAQVRASNGVAKWLGLNIGRELSRQEKVALKVIRARLRVFSSSRANPNAKLWLGIDPIPVVGLGKPRQTRRGVTVGRRRFPGAFVATMRSGHTGVFKRADNTFRRTEGRLASSPANLPIEAQEIVIDNAEDVFRSWLSRAEDRYVQLLRQELNFAFNVEGQ